MRALVILIDGGDPAYFEQAATPNLDRLEREGARRLVRAQMPTVTNVNNVSMICGAPPARHGITANYFLDPRTGREVYMESGEFLLAPTLMERGAAAGLRTAVLASKQKLMDMIGKGAGLAVT
ncbi:MAG: alkaline phosphatase family protein, partial [Candidatus Tectomicrobia bacterium]|nr:alkaline phosphatase family protein [Candidatus Tectomicrobia bacterium]